MRYDAGARAYDQLTGRWSRLYASAAITASSIRTGDRLLDLATGTADAAAVGLQHVGAEGLVVGVDLSVPMLEVAKEKYKASQLLLVAADAGRLPFPAHAFDCAICLFGLMFFPEPVVFLAELRRVIRPGGRVALTVWGDAERAPFAGLMAQALATEFPSNSGEILRPFALSNPTVVRAHLETGGFRDVIVERTLRPASFASAKAFFEPYEQGGGRLGQFFLQLDAQGRDRVKATVQRTLETMTSVGVLSMNIEAFIATGVA
jgi:ubiquinone/menaquinone biosynthesis C-methylase UbiE